MSGAIGGITEKVWAGAQSAFDTLIAWTVAMSLAVTELDLDGGDPEWHESEEKLGTGSLTTEIKGKRQGSISLKHYVKPRAVGTPHDGFELMRHSLGAMSADLTVVSYAAGATDTATLTVDGTAYALLEGTDFAAGASNPACATAIRAAAAAALVAAGVTDVTVSVNAAVVTAFSETHSVVWSSSDAAAWTPTSLRYQFSDKNPDSLQVLRHAGNESDGYLHEVVSGVMFESVEIEQAGNEEGMVTYSGGFARKGFLVGKPQTDASGYIATDTVITLGAGHAGKVTDLVTVIFERVADGVVENNAGAGYVVSAYDVVAGTITLATGLANPLTAAAYYVRPLVPSHAVGGTIQGGIANDLQVAGTSLETEEVKISITTGNKFAGNEIGSDRPTRLTRGKKKRVEVEAKWLTEDQVAAQVGLGWNGTLQSFALRQGPATAGQRMTTTCPATRLSVAKHEVGQEDEIQMTASGKARINTQANDEIVVEFN